MYTKGKGKSGNGKTAASSAVTKAELQGSPRMEGYQGQCWTCGRSLASKRMMQTSEKVEVNRSQKRTEKSEESGSLEMCRNSRRRKKAPAARGADLSTGHMRINAMN